RTSSCGAPSSPPRTRHSSPPPRSCPAKSRPHRSTCRSPASHRSLKNPGTQYTFLFLRQTGAQIETRSPPGSFGAESDVRVDAGGAAGREPGGEEGDEGEGQGEAEVGEGIEGADAEEHAAEEPGQGQSEEEADADPQPGKAESIADDEPEDVALPRAERHADSDLARPLDHAVADHAVDAERGEDERGRREDSEEEKAELAA